MKTNVSACLVTQSNIVRSCTEKQWSKCSQRTVLDCVTKQADIFVFIIQPVVEMFKRTNDQAARLPWSGCTFALVRLITLHGRLQHSPDVSAARSGLPTTKCLLHTLQAL